MVLYDEFDVLFSERQLEFRHCRHAMTTKAAAILSLLLPLHPLQGFQIPYRPDCVSVPIGGATGKHPATIKTEMRRRATTSRSTRASHDDTHDDNGEKTKDDTTIEQDNLKSIRSCSTYALVAGVVGIFTTLTEDDLSSPLDLAARIAVLLHQFVFAAYLYRIWRINIVLSSDTKNVTPLAIFDLTRNYSRLWFSTALVVSLGAIALSTTLPPSLPFQPWLIALGLVVIGSIPLYVSANRAIEQVEPEGKPASDAFASARLMGLRSVRSMRLCLGSFALLGLVQLFTSLLSSPGIVAKGLGWSHGRCRIFCHRWIAHYVE